MGGMGRDRSEFACGSGDTGAAARLLCSGISSFFRIAPFTIAALALIALAVAAVPQAANDLPRDANAYVRDIIANELLAQQNDTSYWRYLQTDEEDGKTTVRVVVETKMCDIHRDLAVDGQPLNKERASKEWARVERLLNDREALGERHASQQKDLESEQRILRLLPNAFHYTFAGNEGNLVKLDFTANPQFRPSSREGMVLRHMAGTLWVDPTERRIARIRGTLTSDVWFGGFLGHLRAGGTFDVQQEDVGGGSWELTRLEVHMRGSMLLFKGIDVEQSQRDTSFERVPSDASPRQVAAFLQNTKMPSASAVTDSNPRE
jgi:hypothetical protein